MDHQDEYYGEYVIVWVLLGIFVYAILGVVLLV